MTLASKFGTGNALAEGGQGFLKETCIKVFNEFIRDGRATQYPKGAFYGGTYSMTNLSNASFLFNVDAALFSHIGKLDVLLPWITDAWLWEHDTEGKCLSWINTCKPPARKLRSHFIWRFHRSLAQRPIVNNLSGNIGLLALRWFCLLH
jgi:hypothetical protein